MKWFAITIHTTEEATEMVSLFFHENGAGGVSIEEHESPEKPRDTSLGEWFEIPPNHIPEGEAIITAYFPETSDIGSIVEELNGSVKHLQEIDIDPGKADVTVAEVREEDWANEWKRYFKPVKVSDRIAIKPTWEHYEQSPGEVVIELDPGMAFGTGTHATTSLCLRTLENIIRPDDHMIDVGTGSGILAIAGAKLGAEQVLALDLDPVAVSSAKENIRLNGLEDVIAVEKSDLLQVLNSERELNVKIPVRVVAANILAEIILKFIDDVYRVLQPGGLYVVSGVIQKKQAEVEKALQLAGFVIDGRNMEEDWVVIIARKP
jgi:ribosomal protein L11 methyltransferase